MPRIIVSAGVASEQKNAALQEQCHRVEEKSHQQTETINQLQGNIVFEQQEKVCVEDQFGSGEVLFARKFSDDRLDLLQRIDDMIDRKEKHQISL
jgi:hypothetical protein